MEITDVLSRSGLNEKEASVYLALLELGVSTVHPIADKAGIKRPTTYLILEDLQRKGLVSIIPREKKVMYNAESPEKLLQEAVRQEELLKRFMPSMLALYNTKKDKPQVQLFEGKEGIKQLYQRIYTTNEVCFFGTTAEVQKYDPEGLWEFVQRTQTEGLKVKDLLTRRPEDILYAKRAMPGPTYDIRFMKPGMEIFTDNAIFGDNVVFFNFHPQTFAVMITSREVAAAIKTLFKFAWDASDPVGEVVK